MQPLLSGMPAPASMRRRAGLALGRWFTWANFWQALRLLGILLFAVLLGLSTLFLPWYFYVAVVLLVAFPVLVFKTPWLAFGLYAAGVLLAPGFKSADAMTLATLGLFVLRWLNQGRPPLLPKALARPYLLFLFAVAVAGAYGLVVRRYPIAAVYGDGRGFVYWLWLPLLFSLVRSTPDGLRKLARVMAFIAGAVAFVAFIQ